MDDWDLPGAQRERETYYDDIEPLEEEKDSGSLSPFTFLCVSLFLAFFGLIVCYSASYDAAIRGNLKHYHYLFENLVAVIPALFVSFFLFRVSWKTLEKISYVFFSVSIVLFILETVSSFVDTPYLSWMKDGMGCDFITFSSIFIASFLAPKVKEKEGRGWLYITLVAAVAILTLLMALGGNYTQAIFYFVMIIILLSTMGIGKRHIFYLSLFIFTAIVFILLLDAKVASAFSSSFFQNPSESQGALRIKAIREGRLFGKGLTKGYYKLGLIDGIEKEYIFVCLLEETGIIGALFVIVLFTLFLVLGVKSSRRASESDERSLYTLNITLTFLVVIKALFSMVTSISALPLNGIDMPFFSASGPAFFLTVIECALLYRFSYMTGRGYDAES